MMAVIDKLASSLNRRDEIPNQELAKQIAAKNDTKAVKELIDLLSHKSTAIQNDCIKVLYEIGGPKPQLIADHIKTFVSLLNSKNNRLQWGAMTALDTITNEDPKAIYALLPKIMEAADKGSVITRDRAVNILIKLCGTRQYADNAFSLLAEQLLTCPVNQFPMYAENSMPVIHEKNKPAFIKILRTRLSEIEKESAGKRVEKLLKKLT